jgi:hypothetical protein
VIQSGMPFMLINSFLFCQRLYSFRIVTLIFVSLLKFLTCVLIFSDSIKLFFKRPSPLHPSSLHIQFFSGRMIILILLIWLPNIVLDTFSGLTLYLNTKQVILSIFIIVYHGFDG